jgi:hypothetical protein
MRWLALLVPVIPVPAVGRLVPIRTVPIAEAHQFLLFPP